MDNIVIFSDRLIDTPPDANYMEEVVAVFATPPNSYSAVADPIDLVNYYDLKFKTSKLVLSSNYKLVISKKLQRNAKTYCCLSIYKIFIV